MPIFNDSYGQLLNILQQKMVLFHRWTENLCDHVQEMLKKMQMVFLNTLCALVHVYNAAVREWYSDCREFRAE